MTTPTDLDTLDQPFVQAFQTLHKILTECESGDRAGAERGVREIRDRESFVEKCAGEDEIRKFLEAGDKIIQEMWRQYTILTEAYTGRLRQYQYVPKTLYDVSTTVWAEVTKSLKPITRDISARMQQNHWKGRGADDYMKQLPMQLSAVTEYGQYVEAATIGVDVPGQLQTTVFIAGAAEINSAGQAIKARATSGNAPSGQYFTASATATAILRNLNRWWTQKLMTGAGSWRLTLDNHVREMTSSQVKNPVVLKGDKWPRATKDTKEIPHPSATPMVDRQSDPAIRGADRSGSGRGVNQGDYHTEDKGGRLW